MAVVWKPYVRHVVKLHKPMELNSDGASQTVRQSVSFIRHCDDFMLLSTWRLFVFHLPVLLVLFLLLYRIWVHAGGVAIFPRKYNVSCLELARLHVGGRRTQQRWRWCAVVSDRRNDLQLLAFARLNERCRYFVFSYLLSAPGEMERRTSFKLTYSTFILQWQGRCAASYLLAMAPIPSSRNPTSRHTKAIPSITNFHVVAAKWRTQDSYKHTASTVTITLQRSAWLQMIKAEDKELWGNY